MESVTNFLAYEGYQLLGVLQEGRCWVLELRRAAEQRPVCPHCGAGAARQQIHGWRTRRVAHLPRGAQPCDLHLHFARLKCQECRRTHTMPLPGIERRARLSRALRDFVALLVAQLQLGLEQLGRWLKLGWNALWRCVQAAAPPRLDTAVHLCLDEVFWREPRQYLTVLSCADGRVLDVERGRGEQPSRLLLKRLPLAVRERVETLATDFSLGQRKAALACLPQTQVVADCFHLVRLARRAVRDAPAEQRETVRVAVRQLRWLLLKRELRALSTWLERWQSAEGSLHTLWKTVSQWELEIEGYLATGRSTGPAEALNRRIALLRRQACGYTNLDNFIRRIMLLNDSLHPER